METKTLLILIGILFVYALVGAAIMMAFEQSNEESSSNEIISTIQVFLADNSACVSSSELETFLIAVRDAYDSGILPTNGTSSSTQWDFGNSVFFVMTALTTIGYGNQTPVTRGGKAFIVIIAMIGIPVTALMILGIAERLKKLTQYLVNKTMPCLKNHPKLEKALKYTLIHLMIITVLILVPSAIFHVAEDDWSYGDAVYYCFITFTTIGFGDYVVGTNSEGATRIVYKFLTGIWIFIGLAWVGAVIGEVTDRYKAFTEKQEKKVQDEKSDDGKNEKSDTRMQNGSKKDILNEA